MARYDSPRSLFDAPLDDPARYMSREEAEALFQRVLGLTKGGGATLVTVNSTWRGALRWAGNRIISSGDTREHVVRIERHIRGAWGSAQTNRLDDGGLRRTIAVAEQRLLGQWENPDAAPLPRGARHATPSIFFRSTYDLSAAERATVGRRLVEPAIKANVRASGYVEVRAEARAVFNTSGLAAYHAGTRGQYSTTVRSQDGTGSGWAGTEENDWSKIDTDAISQRALEKCSTSEKPKAIEPGRYTVILEPQAVHDLFFSAIQSLDRYVAEKMHSVYTKQPGLSKIGLRMLDERLSVTTDPMDPECGYIPFDNQGMPYTPSTWFDEGVLKELSYGRDYAVTELGLDAARPNPLAYRMSGGDATIDQLVAGTARGLLVTRLSDVRVTDRPSLMSTGTTRDGLWLIENGQVKHPIRNFRFNESPMFVFNSVEEIGQTQRVLGGNAPAVQVPAVKARDFTFTSLADAV